MPKKRLILPVLSLVVLLVGVVVVARYGERSGDKAARHQQQACDDARNAIQPDLNPLDPEPGDRSAAELPSAIAGDCEREGR